jgi:hypothetical protein
MGVLLLLSLIVMIRALFIREKGVILLLLSLLVLGETCGAVVTYLVMKLFTIANDYKTLIHLFNTDPAYLDHLFHGNSWALCIFMASFNSAHWIFAM